MKELIQCLSFVQSSPQTDDVIMVPRIAVCSSSYSVKYSGALYVIQGMTMAFGAFLAWETRNVRLSTNCTDIQPILGISI